MKRYCHNDDYNPMNNTYDSRYSVDIFYRYGVWENEALQTNYRDVVVAVVNGLENLDCESIRIWEWKDGEIVNSYSAIDVRNGRF